MAATVDQLSNELVVLVKKTTTFADRAFPVFGEADLGALITGALGVGEPVAGVSYEGSSPAGHSADPKARMHRGSSNVTMHFSLITAIAYNNPDDAAQKAVITNILDEVRPIVLGYQSVNTRPWKFVGETPLESEVEGVIFYGQLWDTDVTLLGNQTA